MQRRTFLCASLGLGAIAAAGATAWHARPDYVTGAALMFGTTVSIKVLHDDRRQAERAIEAAFAAAGRVDALMSLYRPTSQVFALNQTGRIERPDPHLLTVLNQAARLSALTDGAFDITVQPLWTLHSTDGAPSAAALRTARSLVDWRDVSVSAQRVRLDRAGMGITLNGIAQGYAADLARAVLAGHGIRHALLDIGEFASLGAREGGTPWTLGVRDPRRETELAAMLQPAGRSMATSGDYESRFSPDFARHHIFDPRTGDSPAELSSVTVLAPSGMLADGLSTAFMVMGSEKTLALAARLDDVDVLLIDKAGKTWRSARLHA